MKTALVCGAGGFIGSHIARRLKAEGYWVRGADLKYPEFSKTVCDEFVIGDLQNFNFTSTAMFGPFARPFDIVFQLAADMGGAGYVFTGENDADILHNSAMINLNVAHLAEKFEIGKLFFSSSACVYPQEIQSNFDSPALKESDAYPVNPDSDYGLEKIFSERIYLAFQRNYNLDIRIARFHNIFGEEGTYSGGREKYPAAIARKVAQAEDGSFVEVWGNGRQTRSFLHIDECVEGVMRFIKSGYSEPLNIGSEERISVNDLAAMVIKISGKKLTIRNIESEAIGVRGRNSDNTLIRTVLGWSPSAPLLDGMKKLYSWIEKQIYNG